MPRNNTRRMSSSYECRLHASTGVPLDLEAEAERSITESVEERRPAWDVQKPLATCQGKTVPRGPQVRWAVAGGTRAAAGGVSCRMFGAKVTRRGGVVGRLLLGGVGWAGGRVEAARPGPPWGRCTA